MACANRFWLAACLALSATTGSGDAAENVVRIAIRDLAFLPAEVEARAGDIVEWQNADFVDHTATERGEKWDVAIAAEKNGRVRLSEPGTYAYFCRTHPGMTGTIKVVP